MHVFNLENWIWEILKKILILRKLLRQIVSQLKYLRKLLIFETSPALCFSRSRMNNKIFKSCQIPENLKLADISSVFKKDDTNLAKNYRSVSVLPTLSNGFWKKLCKSKLWIVLILFYPCLFDDTKGFSIQWALLSLLERWEKTRFCGEV